MNLDDETFIQELIDLGVDEVTARELIADARRRGRAMGRIPTPPEDIDFEDEG